MTTELEQDTLSSTTQRNAKPGTRKNKTTKKVAAKATVKKRSTATAKKKAAQKQTRSKPEAKKAQTVPSPARRSRAIEKIAYHLSQARGFAPGFEESDWLTAETIIDQMHSDG